MKSIDRREDHPVIMFNPASNVTNEDGKHVFVGVIYGTNGINKDPVKVQQLLSKFKRLNAEQLLTAADGVYTWLLYSKTGDSEIKFVCTEVVAPYEIGTRHQALAFNARIDSAKIYGGGELVKKGGMITFNLLSGTYSKPLIGYNFDKSVRKGMVKAFLSFFPDAQYDKSMDSYIDSVHTVSNELLALYKSIGYTVRLFDTHNDFVNFSNIFWHLDFKLEHYKKIMDESDADGKKDLYRRLYIESLEAMIRLLEPVGVNVSGKKGGGKRKTMRKVK
jgi:hypothetical protein